MPHSHSLLPSGNLPPNDIIMASSLITEPMKLAHQGYQLTIYDDDDHRKIGTVRLLDGTDVVDQWSSMFVWEGQTAAVEAEVDSAVINVMLAFLNSGGEPARLAQIANAIASLPCIELPGYDLNGAIAEVQWISYYTHASGKIYEVIHGVATREIDATTLLETDDDISLETPEL